MYETSVLLTFCAQLLFDIVPNAFFFSPAKRRRKMLSR